MDMPTTLMAGAIALLASLVLLASNQVSAQTRQPVSAEKATEERPHIGASEASAQKITELEAWLKRLTGRFTYTGQVKYHAGFGCVVNRSPCDLPSLSCDRAGCWVLRPASGTADCRAVGQGPGVQCVVNVYWPLTKVLSLPEPSPVKERVAIWPGRSLTQAMAMYGFDPRTLEVRYMLVDGSSIAEAATGTLRGDTGVFNVACVDATIPLCTQTLQIHAPPGGSIEMHLEIQHSSRLVGEYILFMHRDTEEPNRNSADKSR